jgi:sulfur carrier protein ThiS
MKLFLGGSLAFYAPAKQPNLEVQLNTKTPLAQIIGDLGIPIAEVQLTVMNGELVNLGDAFVSDQDEVRLYPPVGGG